MKCQELCDPLNKAIYGKGIRRFHLSCLKCWRRRFYCGKLDKAKFSNSQKHALVAESIHDWDRRRYFSTLVTDDKHGIVMPKNTFTYFLIMRYDYPSPRWELRNAICKVLLSIAEVFAQW